MNSKLDINRIYFNFHCRYMAEELLNDRRVPSADMFSLGLTLYEIACFYADDGGSHTDSERELRITVRLGLPQNGPLWHTLREDRAPPLPSHRCPALQNLVTACMRRMPEARPSAAQVLFLEQVEEVEDDVDPVLLCAPKYVDPPRGTQMRPQFGRSSSVNEAGAAWGAAPEGGHFGLQGAGTGQQGQGQGGGGGLSLGISVSVNNEIDYAALGDGAFTPNFNHHSYSPH